MGSVSLSPRLYDTQLTLDAAAHAFITGWQPTHYMQTSGRRIDSAYFDGCYYCMVASDLLPPTYVARTRLTCCRMLLLT